MELSTVAVFPITFAICAIVTLVIFKLTAKNFAHGKDQAIQEETSQIQERIDRTKQNEPAKGIKKKDKAPVNQQFSHNWLLTTLKGA